MEPTSTRTKQTFYNFPMEVAEALEVVSEVDVETSISSNETWPNRVTGGSAYVPVLISTSPTIMHPKHSMYRDEFDESESEQHYIRFDDDKNEALSPKCVGASLAEPITERIDPIEEEMPVIFGNIHKRLSGGKNSRSSSTIKCKSDKKIETIQIKPVLLKSKAMLDVKEKSIELNGKRTSRDRTCKVIASYKKSKKFSSSLQSGDSGNLLLGPHDSVVSIEDIGSSIKSKPVMVVVRNMDSEKPICEPLNVFSGKKEINTMIKIEKPEVPKKTMKKNVFKSKETKGNVFPRIQTKDTILLQCVLCGKECINKKALIEHVKSHSADKKSFECPTCQKVFTQQCNLKRHMRCHSGERPFSCSYCNKLFADQGYLTTHLRYHTNTKPYTCEHCDKPFFDRSNYVKHLKSHSGEKPYPCLICKKSFLQQSDLTRHTRVHSGERPFKCNSCERSFTQHGDLTTHLRHHTGERPFVCFHCQKTFANKRYMNGHVKGKICLKKRRNDFSRSNSDQLNKLPTGTNMTTPVVIKKECK